MEAVRNEQKTRLDDHIRERDRAEYPFPVSAGVQLQKCPYRDHDKIYIIKLFSNSELIENMFTEYRGEFLRGMSYSSVSTLVIVLCFIGVTAIILAFVGIGSMTKQYESA